MSSIWFDGFAVALAWPETNCKQAGSWYDLPMYCLGFNRNGFYRVGHAAVLLVDDETGSCRYFDFGRYHAPFQYGRVRSAETDDDLKIVTKAVIDRKKEEITNLKDILSELYDHPSTHGTGTIYGSSARIILNGSLSCIRNLQEREFILYGPFIPHGTNCSRFVNRVIRAGKPSLIKRFMLRYPLTVSPSPMWNVIAVGGKTNRLTKIYDADETLSCKKELETMLS
ncbi:MAG: hypothetical protein KFF73_09215 [Cyclobacteriaceae bacterium]|nr:hypothetical protein [Cyclobacteriaceae bacterium]